MDPSLAPPDAHLSAPGVHVSLANATLDIPTLLSHVRSPAAGAIVLFAGTTRDTFDGKPVQELQYSAYAPLALQTMLSIGVALVEKHGLKGVAMVHRLGVVPVGEESVLIAVSAPHRGAAWRAGEEALEEVKERVEVWKREEFVGDEGGVWRANRDGKVGVREEKAPENQGQQGEEERKKGEEEAKRITAQVKREGSGEGDGQKTEDSGNVPRQGRIGGRGHGPVVKE